MQDKFLTWEPRHFLLGNFDPTYSEKEGQPNTDWTITDREATQGWLVDDLALELKDITQTNEKKNCR